MNEREIICLFPFLQYYEFQKYFNNNKYSPSLFLWKMYSFFLNFNIIFKWGDSI